MHTYVKKQDGEWVVGFSTTDFRALRLFTDEAEAAAYVSYLNGGQKPAGAVLHGVPTS